MIFFVSKVIDFGLSELVENVMWIRFFDSQCRYAVAIHAGETRPTAVETSTDATYQNENWNEYGTDSGLQTEFVTATTETAKLVANDDKKSADYPIPHSDNADRKSVV